MKRGRMFPVFFVSVLLLLTACAPTEEQRSSSVEATQGEEPPEDVSAEDIVEIGEDASASVTVEMTSSGFSPKEVTVKKGGTITFVNQDSIEHWPASAMHPTHTVYPTNGGCIGSTFDACNGVLPGESWSFTFDSVGSWSYHDHLNPGMTGKVIVEE